MYPDFQYLIQGLFGIDAPEWLSIFKTFGFIVAMAFLACAYTLTKELKRKEEQGLLTPEIISEEIGKPASPNELLMAALLGLLLGYKLGGMFGNWKDVAPNPMGYMFSLKGNAIAGIIGALVLGYNKYYEKRKKELPDPKIKKTALFPHQRVGEFLMIAAVAGFIGAKVFNAFESWDDFVKDPAGSLFSSSGLTFYGGLITATAAFYFFSRKHNIRFIHLCDAVGPGLMLAYGIGRLGCQFAGDGDWGIFNSAYITQANGALKTATIADYQRTIQDASGYFHSFGGPDKAPHVSVIAPSALPRWLFAMNYPHNVNREGVAIAGCMGEYCTVLPVSVFPTPLYEAIVCIGLFFVLWALRKRIRQPFHLFGVYLILNGLERFFVEKIRVNYKYDWCFIHPTQAEIISSVLVLAGVSIMLFYKSKIEDEIVPG
ncbi:MAG: prolipoprotein diacylglyceryl transferase family protein [Bacteroidota bacterium]